MFKQTGHIEIRHEENTVLHILKNICDLNSTLLCYDRTLSGAVPEVRKWH